MQCQIEMPGSICVVEISRSIKSHERKILDCWIMGGDRIMLFWLVGSALQEPLASAFRHPAAGLFCSQ